MSRDNGKRERQAEKQVDDKPGWCDVRVKPPQIPEAGSGDNIDAPPVSTKQYKTGYAGRAVSGVRLSLGDNPAAYPGGECTSPSFSPGCSGTMAAQPVRAVAVSPRLEMFIHPPPQCGVGVKTARHPGGKPYASMTDEKIPGANGICDDKEDKSTASISSLHIAYIIGLPLLFSSPTHA